ncbi:hypothetical protein, partial [Herbidospora sp. RD11066]
TLQKMSSEMFSQPTSIMNVNQRNPSSNDGVVHHALAFSTLLSSQETDLLFCFEAFLLLLCLYLFSVSR